MRGLPADSLVSPENERMLLVAFESVYLLVITKLPVGFFLSPSTVDLFVLCFLSSEHSY